MLSKLITNMPLHDSIYIYIYNIDKSNFFCGIRKKSKLFQFVFSETPNVQLSILSFHSTLYMENVAQADFLAMAQADITLKAINNLNRWHPDRLEFRLHQIINILLLKLKETIQLKPDRITETWERTSMYLRLRTSKPDIKLSKENKENLIDLDVHLESAVSPHEYENLSKLIDIQPYFEEFIKTKPNEKLNAYLSYLLFTLLQSLADFDNVNVDEAHKRMQSIINRYSLYATSNLVLNYANEISVMELDVALDNPRFSDVIVNEFRNSPLGKILPIIYGKLRAKSVRYVVYSKLQF